VSNGSRAPTANSNDGTNSYSGGSRDAKNDDDRRK
jgi:hypothetical protein